MKIICLAKFVPDVDHFTYDFEKQALVRENTRLSINPDDSCAIAYALQLKNKYPGTFVEVVTMAPKSVIPHMEDLLRLGVDEGIILSDKDFAGSDTYATSKIISSYLRDQVYDCIFTGTHAIDGDTSHVPSQIGEWLDLFQMSQIKKITDFDFQSSKVIVEIEHEVSIETYEIELPAILSLTRESGYKLPYIKKVDISKDVRDKLHFLDRIDLRLSEEETGLKGSKTKVKDTRVKQYGLRDKIIVKADEQGATEVVRFMKEKGLML